MPSAPPPHWKRLYDEFAAAIEKGKLSPNQRLPTEHELSEQRGISRNTVRRAYLALSQAGLIHIVNGRGSFVMQTGLTYEIDEQSRFRDVLARQGLSSSVRLISAEYERADAVVASAFSIKTGSAVLHQTLLICGNDTPFILTSRYIPADLAMDLKDRLARHGSFTATLKDLGHGPLRRLSTTVGSRLPRAAEAELLQCPLNTPVLDVIATGKLDSGRVVEWQSALMNSRLLRLSFQSS